MFKLLDIPSVTVRREHSSDTLDDVKITSER